MFHVAGVVENRLNIVVVGKKSKLELLGNNMFLYMALVDFMLKGRSGWWAGGDVIYGIVDAMHKGEGDPLNVSGEVNGAKTTRPGG